MLSQLPPLSISLWALLAILIVVWGVLRRTSWGKARPTHCYVLLSVAAHVLLICLATTVRFTSAPPGNDDLPPVKVRIAIRTAPEPLDETHVEPDDTQEDLRELLSEPPPEQALPSKPLDAPELVQEVVQPAETETVVETPQLPEPQKSTPKPKKPAEPQELAEQMAELPVDVSDTLVQEQADPVAPELMEQTLATTDSTPPLPSETFIAPVTESTAEIPPDPTSEAFTAVEPVAPLPVLPTTFSARVQDDRLQLVEEQGGSRETEDAVAAALDWLARAQSRDGRWDSRRHSGGREHRVLNQDRKAAGRKADSGVTALALLAFLGAGHTHQEGPYASTVQLGLEHLLRRQQADGGLADEAQLYAQTYCHSMATFALAEAMAVTEDKRLTPAVAAAVDFLVRRQHRTTGGWRYRPGDPGDMSQMGWIIMALRSAELAGIAIPPDTWTGIERFVASVRRGKAGGLACYRVDGPTSRTMTAEAFYCRQILGWPTRGRVESSEAVASLLEQLPGQGQDNLYYWYYATLALHHHEAGRTGTNFQGGAWYDWNDALKRKLVQSQVTDGTNGGSWSPNTMWGGYGGRVYSTAMATMCLEVYYRYDAEEVARDPWIAARPSSRTLR